jgi:sugar phosphate isomerase/epimerase
MTTHRRRFLTATAMAAAGVAAGSFSALQAASAAEEPLPKAALKLSSQLGIIPGKELEEKLAKMGKWGFDGVELGGDIVGNVKKYQDAIAKTKLKFSAVCYGSLKGDVVSEVKSKRQPAIEQLKKVIEAAGELQCTGVIYVPAFNGQTTLTNQEIRRLVLDTLPKIGEFAVKAGTRLLLEPLNRGEAFFLRQLADAASICRDCKSPGVCMMGDFYHMYIEETSDQGAFISAGKYLHHVHLASRKRVMPGQDERRFVDGFKGLKAIGFQDYCSFECGCDGDRETEIPKSMAFLRKEWDLA